MISDDNIISKNIFESRSACNLENQQRNEISQFRNDLEVMGETYSNTRTSTEVIGIENLSENLILVKIKEITFMTIAESGVETGYDAKHDFILEKSVEGKWNIVEDKQLEPSGLLPLSIAEESVDDSSDYLDNVSIEW